MNQYKFMKNICHIPNDRKIFIFGAGERAVVLSRYLRDNIGILICGIVVSDGRKYSINKEYIKDFNSIIYELSELKYSISEKEQIIILNTATTDREKITKTIHNYWSKAEVIDIFSVVPFEKEWFLEQVACLSETSYLRHGCVCLWDGSYFGELFIHWLSRIKNVIIHDVVYNAYEEMSNQFNDVMFDKSLITNVEHIKQKYNNNIPYPVLICYSPNPYVQHHESRIFEDCETITISPTARVEVMQDDLVVFRQIDMPITTNCTLRCKNCGFMMPYYHWQPYIPVEKFCHDIDRLFESIDYVRGIGIVGGESLLHPQLSDILRYLVKMRKIEYLVLTTNGTIPPSDELIELICKEKIYFVVSNYGNISKNITAWRNIDDPIFRSKDLSRTEEMIWRYTHSLDVRRYSRTDDELEEQYYNCTIMKDGSKCFSYFKGNLYVCPFAGHGSDLGLTPLADGEYARVASEKNTLRRRMSLMQMHKLRFVEACNYCHVGTDLEINIPAAEQVDHVLTVSRDL